MSSGQFTQLSHKAFKFEFSSDITDEDLALVTSFSKSYISKMTKDEKDELRVAFRKAKGVLFDTDVNDHGFAMSAKALKYMVSHFNRTIETPYLHNFFADHDFMSVSSMLGRQVRLKFDPKTEQMTYEALLSNKHELVQRAELMKSVSGTIIRGALECNQCGDPYSNGWFPEPSCDHIPNGKDVHPITHKAIHIETSFVTFPAYKKTSVEMFANSSSFASVLKEEFPESEIPDEKAEALARLQAEGLDDPQIKEGEQSKITQEAETAQRVEMMKTMQNLSNLLQEAMVGFSKIS